MGGFKSSTLVLSLKSRCLSTRALRFILEKMGHRITTRMMEALAEVDVGGGAKGEAHAKFFNEETGTWTVELTKDGFRQWPDDNGGLCLDNGPGGAKLKPGEPFHRTKQATVESWPTEYPLGEESSEDGDIGRSGLITLAKALEAVGEHAADYRLQYAAKFRLLNTYRAWKLNRISKSIIIDESKAAVEECGKWTYRQDRKKKGCRLILTRNWSNTNPARDLETGTHAGLPAWRRPRGRPPLSAADWLRRYRLRRLRQRKALGRRYSYKTRKPIQPPKTNVDRPYPSAPKLGSHQKKPLDKKVVSRANLGLDDAHLVLLDAEAQDMETAIANAYAPDLSHFA